MIRPTHATRVASAYDCVMKVLLQIPTQVVSFAQSRLRTDRGAALIEYALLVGLIAVVAIVSVTAFGDTLGDKNTGIAGSINCAVKNPGCTP